MVSSVDDAFHDTSRPLSAVAAVTAVGAAEAAPPRPMVTDGWVAMRVPLRRTMAHSRLLVDGSAAQATPAASVLNTSAVISVSLEAVALDDRVMLDPNEGQAVAATLSQSLPIMTVASSTSVLVSARLTP